MVTAVPLLGRPAFGQEPLRIAFMYVGPVGDYGWSWAHDHSRQLMVEELGDVVETTIVESVPEGPDAERVLRELAQQGNRLIFATSFGFMDAAVTVARQFPDVYFEHATGYETAENLAVYNAKFHEGRSVIGTIAGHVSESGIGGYVASFPIPEVVLGINAFAIAARKVNPDFELRVIWVNSWFDPAREADAARALFDQGVDVITQHTDSPAPLQVAEERGAYGFGQAADMSAFAPTAHLTAILDDWAPYYIERARAVLEDRWETGNVWHGLAEGMVALSPYHEGLDAEVVEAAEAVRTGIIDGSVHSFEGPLVDTDGNERVAAGERPGDDELAVMDWYVEGVQA